jgi:transcriptional regulator with GAF, ATPase, and Fis domain
VLSAAAALAAPAGILELTHLPDAVALLAHARGAPPRAVTSALAPEAELRRSLVALLGEHRGNITEVARAMGKARMQIQRWAKRFAIDVDSFRR